VGLQSAFAGSSITSYTEAMNKAAINAKIGSSFRVSLSSMYWQLSPVKANIVGQVGGVLSQPVMPGPNAPAGCQHPGAGCGKQTWTFKAKMAGTTILQATRTSCGEALRCVGDQGLFTLRVRVVK